MKSNSLLWLCVIVLMVIPVMLVSQVANSEQNFSILRSNSNGISIRFQTPAWDLESVQVKGETLKRVKVQDAPYLFFDETETLPVFSTLIAIPYNGGATLRVLNTSNKTSQTVKADFDATLRAERSKGSYSGSLYPNKAVSISDPQIVRDYRVVSINAYPFQYDQDSGKLLVSESIDIQVDFNNDPSINEIEAPERISQAFEKIYSGMILNYADTLNRDTIYQTPVMLVIYGSYTDATYLAKVNEYIDWKKQKGFIVNSVSTATTGTTNTAIKAYIQSAYNNPSTKPDYIVLIGDVGGTIAVASMSTYADYQYTWLAGSDNLGDAIIGRISVSSTSDLNVYVAKVMSLERDIDVGSAAWLNNMVLVGDTYYSGISTIYTNQYIQDVSIAQNPAYTYTTQYNASPSNTIVNAAINNPGVAFYNYRGYIGMSSWPATMSNLFNGSKLFHAVFITCNTGSFNGDSTTESVIRYGSSASLGGAITAVGMATSSTHTPMNNCLDVGIFHALYNEQMRDMGSSLLSTKLYLSSVYGVSNPSLMLSFSQYCNLMGDPTAEVYVGIPNTFNVTSSGSIAAGTTTLGITVRNSTNQMVEGASVVLTDSNGLQVLGFTDASGYVLLDIPSAQSLAMELTVSKHDFKPSISSVNVLAAGGIVYDSAIIDDTDTGNGDGILNSGETVNLNLTLKNTSSETIFLSADVSCLDPYVTLLDYNRIEYNSIAPNAYGDNESPITFSVASNCPDNHQVVLDVFIEGSSQNWTISVPLTVRNGELTMQSYTLVGSTGNIINPGNSFPMTFSLTNTGLGNLSGIYGNLHSYDRYFSITDSLGFFGTIAAGSAVTNSSNRFEVFARAACVDGMTIPLELNLYNASGFSQTISLTLTIGQTTVTDPLGQDTYGYFIFDSGDTSYSQHPTYQWEPIAPAESGSGTLLSITDPGAAGDEGDQVGSVSIQTVTLPFSFRFYGLNYTQASISSNGFIAFGTTLDSEWRNWRLPGAGGPNPMIAAFWDDLQIGTGSGVYTYYNSALHFYVVEWYQMVSGYDQTTRETFQAILYDPVYYPTYTNDGQIKLQYKLFNNIDLGSGDSNPHGCYSTIGIKDHNGLVGLEYTFNNSYPTAAATLTNLSSLFITTRALLPDTPHIVIQQVNILGGNGNGYLEPGESSNLSIQLRNSGLTGATSVSAVLSSADPYVTINTANASYGNIPAETSADPLSNYTITVAANCPAEHSIMFTLSISGSGDSWIYNFSETAHTPILSFGVYSLNDTSGNSNGSLDPGETVTISIALDNTGMVASPAGTANLTCNTPGISIINGTASFSAVAAEGTRYLNFSISASPSITEGTLASLVFNATAGSFTANTTKVLEIGAPTVVTVGTGTGTQSYPLDRYYNYSAHESIYLASEIGMAGSIKAIAYYKASGADLADVENLSVYMKHTTASTLSTGAYSVTGYTLVYSGTFPNNAGSGWMEVNLNDMFVYDGVQNLEILIVKDFQQWISSYSNYYYSGATSRARQERNDTAAPTNLSVSSNLPNLRFKIFPIPVPMLPPQNLVATAGYAAAVLSWQAPASGSPLGYNLYKNSVQITTTTALGYTDTAVSNGITYSYYVTAVYSNGESEPSNTVSATPTPNIVLGSGTASTTTTTASPVNLYYKSLHGQSVYTAAELNAAGVYGPIMITQMGFYVVSAPLYALPNFIVRMKHITATNVASWQAATDMVTVYSATSYMPTAGGFDLLTLSSPFIWNGVDNLVVDTAFSVSTFSSSSGTIRYTTVANGYRAARNNTADQTNVWTGGSVSSARPNLKLTLQTLPNLATPVVTVNQSGSSIVLHWEQIPNANQYKIYRATDPAGPFSLIGTTSSLQYTDAILTKAFYNVKASLSASAKGVKE